LKDYLKCSDTAVKLLLCHYAKAWYPYITPFDFTYVTSPDGSIDLWIDRDKLWEPNKEVSCRDVTIRMLKLAEGKCDANE